MGPAPKHGKRGAQEEGEGVAEVQGRRGEGDVHRGGLGDNVRPDGVHDGGERGGGPVQLPVEPWLGPWAGGGGRTVVPTAVLVDLFVGRG